MSLSDTDSFQMDGDPMHYRYLNQGKCVRVKGINDQENLREVQVRYFSKLVEIIWLIKYPRLVISHSLSLPSAEQECCQIARIGRGH